MNLETVTLEDNLEYVIMDTLEINGIKYLYLENVKYIQEEKDKPEIVIRKLDATEEMILGLDNEEEYLKALESYVSKNHENIDSD